MKKLLSGLEYEDLQKLRRDLDSGAYLMKHVLNSKINELETSHRKICASCNAALKEGQEDIYSLVFGKNIKKKASFCGLDCLQEFVSNLQPQAKNMNSDIVSEIENKKGFE